MHYYYTSVKRGNGQLEFTCAAVVLTFEIVPQKYLTSTPGHSEQFAGSFGEFVSHGSVFTLVQIHSVHLISIV